MGPFDDLFHMSRQPNINLHLVLSTRARQTKKITKETKAEPIINMLYKNDHTSTPRTIQTSIFLQAKSGGAGVDTNFSAYRINQRLALKLHHDYRS